MDKAKNRDLARFLGDWSQIEELSEIKPPLTTIGFTVSRPVQW